VGRRATAILACTMAMLLASCPGSLQGEDAAWEGAARKFTTQLATEGPDAAARAMMYPPLLSGDELTSERGSVSRALNFGIERFGIPRASAPAKRRVEFFEFLIGTGESPSWWRSSGATGRDVVLLSSFDRLGPGVLKLTVVEEAGLLRVVAVGFGLETNRLGAEREIRDATDTLLDILDVPKDHPARRTATAQVVHE